jgi:hypothetical protein
MNAQHAVTSLTRTHGSRAGGEALRRAMLCERAGDFTRARHWVAVYCGIHVASAETADPRLASARAKAALQRAAALG